MRRVEQSRGKGQGAYKYSPKFIARYRFTKLQFYLASPRGPSDFREVSMEGFCRAEDNVVAEQEAVILAKIFEDPQIEFSVLGSSINSYPQIKMMKCC